MALLTSNRRPKRRASAPSSWDFTKQAQISEEDLAFVRQNENPEHIAAVDPNIPGARKRILEYFEVKSTNPVSRVLISENRRQSVTVSVLDTKEFGREFPFSFLRDINAFKDGYPEFCGFCCQKDSFFC